MRLYLAQAVSQDVDPDRPLSEQGRRDVEHLAALLRNAGIQVDVILHSGKTRAAQTAALLAAAMLPSGQPQARAGLGPTDPLERLAPEVGFWFADTLIVGHLPCLGRLASLLLASDPDRPILAFQPGALACLERDVDGRWLLAWMLRPELLAPSPQ